MLTSGKSPLTESALLAEPLMSASRGYGAWGGAFLRADAAWRLGPRACALFAWHRLRLRTGFTARLLADLPLPPGRLLPDTLPEDGMTGDAMALAAAAEASVAPGWHGPFPADAPALALDLFAAGDIRTVWEANRLLAVPLLALAGRLAPADGHLERAEALLADWCTANPPFRGPTWVCGQEAALRALHLCLALALLDADRAPRPAMRALLGAHARRIAATRAYAAGQDNNHAVSEPAGLFVLGLVLGDRRMTRHAGRDLARAVARLVAPDGSFAQASPGYHRLLLDTLSVAEWFRQRHAAPPFATPFAERAAAATTWLARVMEPTTGAMPRCGPTDDSHVADLALHGAADARGSVGRAQALFGGGSKGATGALERGAALLQTSPRQAAVRPGPPESGTGYGGKDNAAEPVSCAGAVPGIPSDSGARHQKTVSKGRGPLVGWFGGAKPLQCPDHAIDGPPADWHSAGWFGAHNHRFRLLLRTGAPMRFRPGQADLLHLDLTLDGTPLLIDGGSGAYNPPPDCDWWTAALAGTAGHNTIQFDGCDQMPRLGRFLFARWPDCCALPDGASLRDHKGRRHERRVALGADRVTVEDRVSGPFTNLVLRWRLAPGVWERRRSGVVGPGARITLSADAPCAIRLASGWHSPAYGTVEPTPVLELIASAPVSRLTTRVEAA